MERKLESPYAAAAAGCVLVQAETEGARQDWDRWLENLALWNDWLPDAHALLGVRRLRTAETVADLDRARASFEQAVHAGIPSLAPVARLLLEGVTTLVADPKFHSGQLDKVQPSLRAILLRMDGCQPLTVLRFSEALS